MLALSIRQPWCWLILHAGKNIENRTWATKYRGPILIHASKGMTRDEYEDAADFACFTCGAQEMAPFETLQRGGIVGRARIVDCVTASDSPWFCGPFGFVLEDIEPLPFRPLRGALGFFDVPVEATA
jgi:hypothetical protein